MKRLFILTIICLSLVSCEKRKNIEDYDISKIEVFYVSFGVLTPTPLDEQSIREVKSYFIEDITTIDSIKSEIKNLIKLEKKQFVNNIYLICDFYSNDDKVYTLMFDKGTINIDGIEYKENEKLINLLIKKGDEILRSGSRSN